MTLVPGCVLKLRSGNMVEVLQPGRGGRIDCRYVTLDGTPCTPLHHNEVSLSRDFLVNYARHAQLMRVDNKG